MRYDATKWCTSTNTCRQLQTPPLLRRIFIFLILCFLNTPRLLPHHTLLSFSKFFFFSNAERYFLRHVLAAIFQVEVRERNSLQGIPIIPIVAWIFFFKESKFSSLSKKSQRKKKRKLGILEKEKRKTKVNNKNETFKGKVKMKKQNDVKKASKKKTKGKRKEQKKSTGR